MAGLIPRTVREALAQQLTNNLQMVIGVHAYAPGSDPDFVPAYPAILIGHADGTDYALTFGARGIAQMSLEVEVRTASGDNGVSAEMAADDLFAAGTGANSSVYDALMTDVTLGGVVSTLKVESVSPPRPIDTTSGRWSFTYTVSVYAPRSAA